MRKAYILLIALAVPAMSGYGQTAIPLPNSGILLSRALEAKATSAGVALEHLRAVDMDDLTTAQKLRARRVSGFCHGTMAGPLIKEIDAMRRPDQMLGAWRRWQQVNQICNIIPSNATERITSKARYIMLTRVVCYSDDTTLLTSASAVLATAPGTKSRILTPFREAWPFLNAISSPQRAMAVASLRHAVTRYGKHGAYRACSIALKDAPPQAIGTNHRLLVSALWAAVDSDDFDRADELTHELLPHDWFQARYGAVVTLYERREYLDVIELANDIYASPIGDTRPLGRYVENALWAKVYQWKAERILDRVADAVKTATLIKDEWPWSHWAGSAQRWLDKQ